MPQKRQTKSRVWNIVPASGEFQHGDFLIWRLLSPCCSRSLMDTSHGDLPKFFSKPCLLWYPVAMGSSGAEQNNPFWICAWISTSAALCCWHRVPQGHHQLLSCSADPQRDTQGSAILWGQGAVTAKHQDRVAEAVFERLLHLRNLSAMGGSALWTAGTEEISTPYFCWCFVVTFSSPCKPWAGLTTLKMKCISRVTF